ncbi:uncharacterized protein L3040_001198 [Drepanopeziza brunnea f. sp. 'multigermtubi']|uniref:Uncharacterized protein n=1 Tax=Marssonina brunnea f. sp. multigermtubi (strain MB_m1) TaxID=1072389 RepID=K1W4E8_MARBU|nr:uncharacterized protein MBM_10014 [Drepanopeziza brunnea f. sp. 'multigermtubi' MB_m1]EKD11845.1 hypothetical protein MBM_10014 [Drepanopeziza brunnea f. sp. 'multigermtubi' MB_m1]KAJ5054936.1 hypothetical protein L3040_001198 [Drepanopeziza brunnea f. sp. 'multigermtubi']
MAADTQSTSASALSAVPFLDEENWVEFLRRIGFALVNKNYIYEKILQGTKVRPVRISIETELAFKKRLDAWDELQTQGCSLVRSRLGPIAADFAEGKGIGLTIIGTTEEHDLKKLLMVDLKERFRPKGVSIFYRLQSALLALRIDEFDNITSFNNEFVRLNGQLKLFGSNTQLSALWMVGVYLSQLPPSYENFKSNWISNNNYIDGDKSKTALAELMAATRKEELTLKSI